MLHFQKTFSANCFMVQTFTACLYIILHSAEEKTFQPSRIFYWFIYLFSHKWLSFVKQNKSPKTLSDLVAIHFWVFFHVTLWLSVRFSPLPPSLLCVSADSSWIFCQEGAKYQSVPALLSKYTPVWEQVYPSSCTCTIVHTVRIPYVCEACAWILEHSNMHVHGHFHMTDSFHTFVQGSIFCHLPPRPFLWV